MSDTPVNEVSWPGADEPTNEHTRDALGGLVWLNDEGEDVSLHHGPNGKILVRVSTGEGVVKESEADGNIQHCIDFLDGVHVRVGAKVAPGEWRSDNEVCPYCGTAGRVTQTHFYRKDIANIDAAAAVVTSGWSSFLPIGRENADRFRCSECRQSWTADPPPRRRLV